MTWRRPLTELAQQTLADVLGDGDFAVDATVGNGHDTLFLAEQVGEHGHVWGFDVQQAALAQAGSRLLEAGLNHRVTLLHASHAQLAERLSDQARGQLAAVMFNLGYLPGSDKRVTTGPDSTLAALDAAAANLRSGGVISVLAYRGHAGGLDEATAVAAWMASREGPAFALECHQSPGPVLYLLRRRDDVG